MREAHDCNFHDRLRACINDRCPLHRGMRNLGRCLRDAGALCEAWELGHAYGYQACPCGGYLPGDEEVREEEERILRLHFRPGHALPDSKGKG